MKKTCNGATLLIESNSPTKGIGNMKITEMSAEQRAEVLEIAQAARAAKKEEQLKSAHLLKNNFMDKPHWRRLASKFGVRMPADYVPGTEARLIRRAMKRSGVTPEMVRDAFGTDVKGMAKDNPTWPCYALIGMILEMADESDA